MPIYSMPTAQHCPQAQHPLVIVNGQILSSGDKIAVPAIR